MRTGVISLLIFGSLYCVPAVGMVRTRQSVYQIKTLASELLTIPSLKELFRSHASYFCGVPQDIIGIVCDVLRKEARREAINLYINCVSELNASGLVSFDWETDDYSDEALRSALLRRSEGESNHTILCVAIRLGLGPAVKTILTAIEDINTSVKDIKSVILPATSSSEVKEEYTTSHLLAAIERASWRDDDSTYFEIVKLLLAAGADVHKADSNGYTPLLRASEGSNVRLVELLLDRGARGDIHKANNNGDTPLHAACGETNSLRLIQLLLDAGAKTDIHNTNSNGDTPLHRACTGTISLWLIQLLLDTGAQADMHKANNNGDTPLHRACRGI